jgi:hypothetical protein
VTTVSRAELTECDGTRPGYGERMDVSRQQAPGGEPAERRTLYVPVRQGPAGHVVRLWRTPFGSRTAVAFTSDRRLRSVLGPTQPWIKLSESALRAMAEPLGARHLTVDPLLTARPPAAWSRPAAAGPAETSFAAPAPDSHPQQPASTTP